MSPSKDLCIKDFDNKIYYKIIIIQYSMSWFNILMSNYKISTRAKVSSQPVPNDIFLSNRFGLTKVIWRSRGEYKYCHKINNIALTYCLSAPSSLYCSIFFYLIFLLFFYIQFSFYYFSSWPGLGTILWQTWKISAADVRRRGRCVHYSIRTERFRDVTRKSSVKAGHVYIL